MLLPILIHFTPQYFCQPDQKFGSDQPKLNKNYLTSYPDITIGTSRSKGVTATRMSLKKSLQRLFLPTYFVNCRLTLLKLNFKGPNSSSEREIKFLCRLFTSSIKCEIRHFHVVVVLKRERNVQKSVMHVQCCCFAN